MKLYSLFRRMASGARAEACSEPLLSPSQAIEGQAGRGVIHADQNGAQGSQGSGARSSMRPE